MSREMITIHLSMLNGIVVCYSTSTKLVYDIAHILALTKDKYKHTPIYVCEREIYTDRPN